MPVQWAKCGGGGKEVVCLTTEVTLPTPDRIACRVKTINMGLMDLEDRGYGHRGECGGGCE